MAVSVVATGNAAVSASRSPSVTFASYTPALNDCVIFASGNGANTGAVTAPANWSAPTGVVASDSHSGAMVYHFVTAAEVSAVTTTYTATNWWNATNTGNVAGIVLRGVDPDIQWDDVATGFSSANAATPHVIPALTNSADIQANSMVLGAIIKDGAAGTWTTPAGWTARGTNTSNVSTVLYTRDALTTAGVGTSSVNVTPNAGDEYVAFAIAFPETPTAGAKIDTLVDDAASLNTSVWDATGSATVTGGQFSIPAGGSLDTDARYDLTASSIFIEIPNPANASGDPTETWFALNRYKAAYTYIGLYFRLWGGNIYFGEYLPGVADETSLTYDSTNHKWLKLSESGGTITWATSPDGSAGSWTTRRTKTPGITVLTNFYVGLRVATNGLVFSDTFTRADSTTSPGPGWTNRNGTPGVKSNQFYNSNTTTGNQAQTASSTAVPASNDAQVTATLAQIATGECNLFLNSSSSKVCAICQPTNIIRTTTDWGLGGGQTTRATLSGSHTNGDVYTLKQVGTLFTAYRNGVSIGTWDDTGGYIPRTSGQRNAGLHIYHSTVNDTGRWDNFILEDLGATASTVVMDNINNPPVTGMTGTMGATLRTVSASLTAAQTQTGAVAASVRPLSASASGAQMVPVTGTIAATAAPLTAAVTGGHAQTGTIAAATQPVAAALSGTQMQTGVIAASARPVTADLAGALAPSGIITAAVRPLTASVSGGQAQTGTITAALVPAKASLAGVMQPSGTITASLQQLTAAVAGAQTQTGTITASTRPLTADLAGALAPSGAIAAATQTLAAALTGAQTQTGVIAATMAAPASALTGALQPAGAIAAALRPLTAALAGSQIQTGVIAATVAGPAASLTGQQAQTGVIAAALRALAADLTGAQTQTGVIASATQPVAGLLSGGGVTSGTIAGSLQPVSVALVGGQPFIGVMAVTVTPLSASLAATQTQAGVVAAALQPVSAALLGAHTQTGVIAVDTRPVEAAVAGGGITAGSIGAVAPIVTASLAGSQPFIGVIAVTLQTPTSALVAGQAPTGVITAALTVVYAAGVGKLRTKYRPGTARTVIVKPGVVPGYRLVRTP
jgi:hypothetical protein